MFVCLFVLFAVFSVVLSLLHMFWHYLIWTVLNSSKYKQYIINYSLSGQYQEMWTPGLWLSVDWPHRSQWMRLGQVTGSHLLMVNISDYKPNTTDVGSLPDTHRKC
jgi:hypothetical protein